MTLTPKYCLRSGDIYLLCLACKSKSSLFPGLGSRGIYIDWCILGVLTINMGNLEILDVISNGLSHSIRGASENRGSDLRKCNFCTLFSVFS